MIAAGVRPSRAQLTALLGTMLLFWSANFIFAKMAVRELPPFFVVCARTVISGVFMWPVYAFAREKLEPGVRRWRARDTPALLALGILGVLGNQMLFVIGLSRTSVAHGSLITATGPIFVLLGATLAGLERLTPRKLLAVLVAASGVAVLQLGRSHGGGATLAGDLIVIVSTMTFAGFTLFGKHIVAEFGSITVNVFAFAGGAVLLLPFLLWGIHTQNLAHISLSAWTGIFYMALFPSIAGYLIYAYALRYLPASRVSSVTYLQPVLATLLAVLFLREQPGPAFAGGAALVLGGVYVAERR